MQAEAASAQASSTRQHPLKVYGWGNHSLGAPFNTSARVIVATSSFAKACAAAEAAGLEKPGRDYYSETKNEQELEVALAAPGQVFATQDGYGTREYFPVHDSKLDKSN